MPLPCRYGRLGRKKVQATAPQHSLTCPLPCTSPTTRSPWPWARVMGKAADDGLGVVTSHPACCSSGRPQHYALTPNLSCHALCNAVCAPSHLGDCDAGNVPAPRQARPLSPSRFAPAAAAACRGCCCRSPSCRWRCGSRRLVVSSHTRQMPRPAHGVPRCRGMLRLPLCRTLRLLGWPASWRLLLTVHQVNYLCLCRLCSWRCSSSRHWGC